MADTNFVPLTPEALATAVPTSSIELRVCRHDALHTSDAGEGDVDLRLYYDRFTPPLGPNAELQRFAALPLAPQMLREGTAPAPQLNGAPAPAPQLNGAPAPNAQLNGAPAPNAQHNGPPAPVPQLNGVPAPSPRLAGSPGPAPQLEGPPVRPAQMVAPLPTEQGLDAPVSPVKPVVPTEPFASWFGPRKDLANEKWVVAIPFDVASFDITDIPIVGGVLPPELGLGFRGFALVHTASGVAVRPDITLCNDPLALPLVMLPQGDAFHDGAAKTSSSTTSTSSIQPVWWCDVKKPLGPLDLRRLGLGFQDQKLWLLMDASLQLGQIKLIAIGLGLGINLEKLLAGQFTLPSFTIDGLGVEVRTSSGTTVGGVLVRQKNTITVGGKSREYDGYVGAMVIQTSKVALSALGSFEAPPGEDPSLFAYGTVTKPIGGPPFFYVTGLSLGFGVNMSFKLPDVDRANEFPLVKKVPSVTSALTAPKLEDVLDTAIELRGYQERTPGKVVMALGVNATSFGLINTNAVLLATIGDSFDLDLIGQSGLQLPPDNSATRIADIRVNWRGHWSSNSDKVWVRGMVRPGSWAFHRRFGLSGELAFEAWTQGPNAGDFVLTLGGYAPSFSKPEHYPSASRLAIGWSESMGKVSVEVKGEGYCAITPSMFMTGGSLKYSLSCGDFEAWFKLGADFELRWNPFRYRAKMSVEVGARYTLNLLLFSISMDVSIGAELELWGPDIGGKIKFSLLDFIDVEIGFGANDENPPPLTWNQFKSSFLPVQPLALRAKNGVCGEQNKGTTSVWIVGSDDLAIDLELAIPGKQITVNGGEPIKNDGKQFGVRPMKLENVATSNVDISIRDKNNALIPYTAQPSYRNMPAAQWGPSSLSQRVRLVQDLLAGVSLTKIGVVPGSVQTLSPPVPKQIINYDDHPTPPEAWVKDSGASVNVPAGTYATQWAAAPAVTTRTALLRELYGLAATEADPTSEHRTDWIEELQTIPTRKTKTKVAA